MVRRGDGEGQGGVDFCFFFHGEDGEGTELLVDLEELGDVLDYHFAVDDLQSVVGGALFCLEGAVDDVCQEGAVAEVGLYVGFFDKGAAVGDVFVYKVGCAVEDVAEQAVVDGLGVGVGLLDVCYVLVVEGEGAAYVCVEG